MVRTGDSDIRIDRNTYSLALVHRGKDGQELRVKAFDSIEVGKPTTTRVLRRDAWRRLRVLLLDSIARKRTAGSLLGRWPLEIRVAWGCDDVLVRYRTFVEPHVGKGPQMYSRKYCIVSSRASTDTGKLCDEAGA